MTVPYILTDTALTVVINNTPTVVPNSHPNFQAIIDGILAGIDIEPLVNIPKAIATYTSGAIQVIENTLYFQGNPLDNLLARRILNFVNTGNPALADPLCRFLERCQQNPSKRVARDLYAWLEANSLPITADGCFIAQKIVRDDYLDVYSGKFDNSPGQILSMPRNQVDDDHNNLCSTGFHFCDPRYIKTGFGGAGTRVVTLKIDPADVVSFPADHVGKGRACRYEVIGEVPRETAETHFDNAGPVYEEVIEAEYLGWGEIEVTSSLGNSIIIDMSDHAEFSSLPLHSAQEPWAHNGLLRFDASELEFNWDELVVIANR